MAEKVRIYQLAKDLGVETKEMLTMLDDMGVEYKSHASSLEADVADTIRQLVEGDGASAASAGAAAATSDAGTVSGSAAAESAATEVATSGAAVAVAEAPTPAEVPESVPRVDRSHLSVRAPVVTVMGHVDHGKTSLLDHIRKTKVAAGEAGGITQHIGAYQAETPSGTVTFLDTPGHEAFTAIRQRGANATDIVVIVVAADDSIMPQTREAIAHAKAAKVPIIVAINKIDLPQAQPDRVMRDLMQVDLVPESYGGDTVVVPISAMTGEGVDDLLEMISLVAEVEDLRADPEASFEGVVVESVLDKRAGVLVTVLVREGTVRVGEYLISGEVWGKVRRLTDHTAATIDRAGPSVPVQVLGFSILPQAGETVVAVRDEASAKQITSERRLAREEFERESIGRKGLTLADLFGKPSTKTINLVLRADTQGSLEALKGVIEKAAATTEGVDVELMLAEVGAPSESDLLLASTGDATVMVFGVNPAGTVIKSAERQKIPLKTYKIIYDLIEDVQRMIRGQIEPEFEERILGQAEVRMVIKVPRSGNIAGSYVTSGTIRRGVRARLSRDGREVYKGTIAQLRRFKDDVREVGTGFECGINLQNYDNVQEGDIIEAYEMVEVPAG
ncbi:MAG: translation initiation factor IF-2 [Trueperaceae bacterium]|nr:translation initiation factor IF-2 [Trueperaceae bacterium]